MKRVAIGAAMAMSGAAVIAGLEFVQGLDFGEYTPFVVAIASVLINAARVFFLVPKPHEDN